MKKQKQTLQQLVHKYVEDHYIFKITTECNTGFIPCEDIEWQLREITEEHYTNNKYICHISTRDEGQFYKQVVEYILESSSK